MSSSSSTPISTKQHIKALALKKSLQSPNILFQIHSLNQAHIIFNRPKIMNAFSFDMYFSFIDFLKKSNEMSNIKYIIIRGNGGNFSSGNDLNNFNLPQVSSLDKRMGATAMAQILEQLTITIVKSRKPIFAIVEGRAVGFAFTQLALYDRVFATDGSVFVAPLVKIAQGPQMASSYLFPKIFGQSLSQQIIIKSKIMTSKQLQQFGFLQSYQTVDQCTQACQQHIQELQKLDWNSYLEARKLMRLTDVQKILKANELECLNLVERWVNPDLIAIVNRVIGDRKNRPKL